MKMISHDLQDGQRISGEFSFCVPAESGHVCLGRNLNPHLAWSAVPQGTKSFVLICHDPDVPSSPEDVNQEGRSVPATLPRVDFFHWVLVDIPADTREIARGSHSDTVTPGGKSGPLAPLGRHGINDYTAWFAGDDSMRGDYYGYDGPCPPWNDEIVHRYVFSLYALDIERCPVEDRFGGADVRNAIVAHVLAEAHLTGLYSLNPALTD